MNGWRFVEQERLRVGDPLPEGCALVASREREIEIGNLAWFRGLIHIIAGTVAHGFIMLPRIGGATKLSAGLSELFWVVEPIPAAPQKLGRLPKVGEKFWVPVEVKCTELDPLSEEPVYTSVLGWLSEADLGIDNSAKRAELAAARARVAELEQELGVGSE